MGAIATGALLSEMLCKAPIVALLLFTSHFKIHFTCHKANMKPSCR